MDDKANNKELSQFPHKNEQSQNSSPSSEEFFISASTWKNQRSSEQRRLMQKIAEQNRIEQERELRILKQTDTSISPQLEPIDALISKNTDQTKEKFEQIQENAGPLQTNIAHNEQESIQSQADLAYNIENSITSQSSKKVKKNRKDSPIFTIKKTKTSILLNFAIVIICITGAYFALQEYYNAINASFEKLDEEPIGTIVYKYNIAQRKMTDRVVWDRLKQDSFVYNGDLIRTAELSEATITFLDGSSIDLFDQTLTQVFYDDSGALVDFSGGEISVNATQSDTGIRLIAGETEVQLAKGATLNASAQTTQEDGITSFVNSPVVLQLNEGDAQILVDNDGVKEEVVVEPGSALLLDPVTSSVEMPPFSLQSPQSQLTYIKYENETIEVPFEWTVSDIENPPSVIIEISPYRDFSENLQSYSYEGVTNVSIPFEKGNWYWRLHASGSTVNTSGKVAVLDSVPLSQISPRESSEFFYRKKNPSVRFAWTDDDNVSEWLFEIADNESMMTPIVSQYVKQPSSIITSLTGGKWFWRVTPKYPPRSILSEDVLSYTPSVKSFMVTQQEKLQATTLLSPPLHGFVNIKNEDSPQFVWKYDTEAAFYTVSISKNANMSNPVITEKTNDAFFALKSHSNDIDEGLWYWAVTKNDSEGTVSPLSHIGSFYAIDGEPVYDIEEPESAAIFTEESIKTAHFSIHNNLQFNTLLQVSSDPTFSTIQFEQEVDIVNERGAVTGITIPRGSWYWRTVSIDEKTGIKYITDAKQFFVDFTLSDVILSFPSENTTIKTHPDHRQTFEWEEVENADYYTFTVFAHSDPDVPVFERKEVIGTQQRVNISNYADAQYGWSVKAISTNTPSSIVQESETSVRSFSVQEIKPVVLTGLSRSIQFNGVSALINPQSIGWSSSEPIVSSEFILSKTNRGLRQSDIQNGVSPRESDIVMRIKNPTRSIKLDPLNEGSYYWTVIARTTGGVDISAAQPRQITVLPLDLLPSVTNMVPLQNIVLSNSDLRKGYIDFSWDKVANADEYHFVLYDQNNEIVWETMLGNASNVHFDQISLLDRGTFTWTVEARRQLPNKTVQKGIVATSTFTIDIGQQIIPQDKTTEGQYGF